MSKSKVSLYSGILFLVYGICLLVGSLFIKNSGLTKLGAGFIPEIVSILMIALSTILVIQGWFEMKLTKAQVNNLTKTKEAEKVDNKTVLMTMVIIIVYVALLKSVGFIIMSILYLFCQMVLLENTKLNRKKIIILLIIAIVTPIIINYIFGQFFNLTLPEGILR
ncbi:MAG: tripartite tricarboxylate transporter TctB family protein [Clostridium sp.]